MPKDIDPHGHDIDGGHDCDHDVSDEAHDGDHDVDDEAHDGHAVSDGPYTRLVRSDTLSFLDRHTYGCECRGLSYSSPSTSFSAPSLVSVAPTTPVRPPRALASSHTPPACARRAR